jgi:hypothetical protein
VVAPFNGGVISSDGGASLFRQTDQRLNLLGRAAACFDDHRDPLLIKHPVEELLAGKSTLNRLELSTEEPNRYKKICCRQEALDELLTTLFFEAHRQAPKSIVLDLDATDMPLHGSQEGRFFHGYSKAYCYLPQRTA